VIFQITHIWVVCSR